MAGFLRVALMVGLATLAGCLSNPVGETLREPDEARIEDRRSALDSDRPSDATVELLESLGIFDWDRNPYDLIDRLGKAGEFSAGAVSPWRLKLAEAEIAYWIAARHKRLDDVSQNHYLIAARAALEGMEIRGRLGAFNPRERLLLDLHNGGLTRYLEVTQERWGHPRDWEERARAEGLPRPIVISGTGTHQLDQFDSFVAADRLRIDGVRRRQRQFGLGAAIIAVFENLDQRGERVIAHYLSRPSFPATARITRGDAESFELRFFDPMSPRSAAEAEPFPLSADFSAALIHGFARERFHILENLELFFPDRREDGEGLYLFEPYDPERIPVLLIHGIWSSPITFLELHNEIIGDPQLNTRFQVWSYLYPTGLSVWENAARLRRRLKALRHTLDPSGRDPAMRDMVVVGHSMGGLLARTLAQDSGDKVGSAFFNRPTSELGLPEELAQRLDEIFHFSPLDYLSRIIFVATPHRGSGYASSILGSLVSKLVDSPDFLQRELDWLIERRPEWVACRSSRLAELGDSVLDLEYDSVTIRVFQSLTWDPRIAIHTILGTTIADQIVPDTTDGIVDYSSGHLDQAISERIVPTGHAVHKHPLAIQEIRRILRKHATP